MQELWTDEQTASALQISKGTLANWRCSRLGGPAFIRIGRHIRYRPKDIEEYMEQRRVVPEGRPE